MSHCLDTSLLECSVEHAGSLSWLTRTPEKNGAIVNVTSDTCGFSSPL